MNNRHRRVAKLKEIEASGQNRLQMEKTFLELSEELSKAIRVFVNELGKAFENIGRTMQGK